MGRLSKKCELERSRGMRSLCSFSKRKPSRGRVFYNGSGGSAPKFQFRTRSVTVVKNTSGSGFLCFEKLHKLLLNALPLCLFFSYYPVISLGSGESMNFELSVPLLWLVVFDVVVFVRMVLERRLLGGIKGKWLLLLFPVWVTISLIWSLNVVRGVLTVGIMWLLVFAGYAMWTFREVFDEKFRTNWLKWLLGSTLFVCGWCLVQCILDLAGVSRDYSLMCAGCTYRMFGFPHPNGFAIEPQFMGNLLLAPMLATVYLIIKDDHNSTLRGRGSSRPSSRGSDPSYLGRNLRKPLRILLLVVFLASLFLTFSRGAIYAGMVGLVFLTAFEVVRTKKWNLALKIWGVVVLAFLFTLNLQGVMAAVSPTNDTYMSGVAKVLNHLSLGIIDIRGSSENSGENDVEMTKNTEVVLENRGEQLVENYVENSEEKVVENFDDGTSDEAVFDGYVAESTEVRMKLTNSAVRAWSGDASTFFLGSGIGGAGVKLFNDGLIDSPKEIVQNEYASLLLETGLIGIFLFALMLVLIVRTVLKNPMRGMILSLLVAYSVSLFFFSGFANALQIYLLPMVLMFI